MSYDLQETPIALSNEHGTAQDPYIIEELSFQSLYDEHDGGTQGGRPITLENCSYITIRRIDTRQCTMGLLFALNCDHIVIEYIRIENVNYQWRGWDLNQIPRWGTPGRCGDPYYECGNDNNMNFIQFDKVSDYQINDIKGRYGNTEDGISNYQSHDGVIERVHLEGAIATNQDTSNGAESVMWTSDSGTGIILGDQDGYNVEASDCQMINAGQVLYQGMGHDQGFDDCIGISEGDTGQPWNNGCTTWEDGEYKATSLHFTNMDVVFYDGGGSLGDGYWWVDEVPDTSGSNFQNTSLDVEDYRVVL